MTVRVLLRLGRWELVWIKRDAWWLPWALLGGLAVLAALIWWLA